jgi:adenylyl cyclase-associated protein
LEAVEAKIGAGAPAGAAPAAGPAAAGEDSASARAWDDFLASYWAPFVATTEAIGGDNVKKQVALLSDANKEIRRLINLAAQAKQPSVEKLKDLLAPIGAIAKQVKDLRENNRKDKQWEHLSTLSEGVAYVNWVVVAPTPAPFVKEALDSSLFWSNKILTIYKGKEQKHIDWCNQLKEFFNEMQKYIKSFHTTGLAWNPKGKDVDQVSAAPAAAAPPAAGPPPPGPPPPPSADFMKAASAPAKKAAGPDANALFAELNKGADITSGLKKVTKDMQTHKNPALRAGGVVKVAEKAEAAPAKAAPAAQKQQPPKGPVLEGNKWVIEHHVGNQSIKIPEDELESKNTIYIYKCERSTIQVPAKANSIVIDGGKRLGVVFQDIISGVEIVNSQSVNIQTTGKVPNFAVDKSSSVQIILSKESLNAQVVTSKCDSVNIMFPDGDDHIELPVPEQFITTIDGKKLKTTTLEHE